MFKVTFSINGEIYKGLFYDEEEIETFIRENKEGGDTIIQLDIKETSVVQIWYDNDFDDYYKIEIIGHIVIPKDRLPKKVDMIEDMLKEMHII